jgi:hypothetical protein
MANLQGPLPKRVVRPRRHRLPGGPLDRRRTPLLNPERLGLIAEWFRQAEQAAANENVFDGFFKLWMAFNGWTSAVTLLDRDAPIIDAAARDPGLRAAFEELRDNEPGFADALARFVHEWPVYSESKAYRNYYEIHGDYPPDLDILREFCENDPGSARQPLPDRDGIVDWENTLRVIYQVRCNFFHGGKGPSLNRDRILVSCSFELLHRLIVSTGLLWRAL